MWRPGRMWTHVTQAMSMCFAKAKKASLATWENNRNASQHVELGLCLEKTLQDALMPAETLVQGRPMGSACANALSLHKKTGKWISFNLGQWPHLYLASIPNWGWRKSIVSHFKFISSYGSIICPWLESMGGPLVLYQDYSGYSLPFGEGEWLWDLAGQ